MVVYAMVLFSPRAAMVMPFPCAYLGSIGSTFHSTESAYMTI